MTAGRHCASPHCGRALKPGVKLRNGWCPACYARWRANGCPEDGPPPPKAPSREYMIVAKAARVAKVQALAARGLDLGVIARHMELARGTVQRYLKISPPEGAAVAVDALKAGAEVMYSSAAHQDSSPARPPDTEYRHGRIPEAWEKKIIEDAYVAMRERDASVLAGVAMRKVA